jgi:hypothetical protein
MPPPTALIVPTTRAAGINRPAESAICAPTTAYAPRPSASTTRKIEWKRFSRAAPAKYPIAAAIPTASR